MAAWQRWMRQAKDGCGKSGCGMVDIGYGKGGFCVNFDFIFIFFCGSSFGFRLCYWFDLILGWIFFFVGSWWWSWGMSCWWWKGVGFLLWAICGFMVVKVGGCRGDGGGVAMGFEAEVSGVAMGWWRGHGFRWLRFLGLPW